MNVYNIMDGMRNIVLVSVFPATAIVAVMDCTSSLVV